MSYLTGGGCAIASGYTITVEAGVRCWNWHAYLPGVGGKRGTATSERDAWEQARAWIGQKPRAVSAAQKSSGGEDRG